MHSLKEKLKEQLSITHDAATGRILDKILSYAVQESVDQLLIEKSGQEAAAKFYDAGEKKGELSFSEKTREFLSEAIKKMAGLRLDSSGVSKSSGVFKKEFMGGKMIFNVSVYPEEEAEKIIISLERQKFHWLSLSQLGLNRSALIRVKEALDKKRGLVLDIGTFGSGKTSSLYAFLGQANRPDLNMATLETEISHDIPWANQSRLNPGAGFDHRSALASVLRQDPDVVMIDEMIDKETIDSALHLADRGYFVLAGLYGRDIASTLDFLQGLGSPLNLFAETVKLVINQRLSRRNCPHCLRAEKITDSSWSKAQKYFSKNLFNRLKDDRLISESLNTPKDIVFYRGSGCSSCGGSGFSGRIGIFEILSVDDQVKKHIKEGHWARVREEISNQNQLNLIEDALVKAAQGLISLEEALRLIEE